MLSDEIERIRVRFQSPEFAQVRCLMRFDGHQCSEVLFGLPLDEAPARPRIVSGLSVLAGRELDNLFDQAGLLVDQVPGCVTHPRWKELLNCNPPGYKKWAAFLASGPRGFHVNATPDWPYVWIDAIGPVSAAACDDLAVHAQDPWSIGRMKRRWLQENPDLLEKQFESIRTKHHTRVLDAGGGGRGPWKFRKSLCDDYGLNCPEFGDPVK